MRVYALLRGNDSASLWSDRDVKAVSRAVTEPVRVKERRTFLDSDEAAVNPTLVASSLAGRDQVEDVLRAERIWSRRKLPCEQRVS